MRKIKGVNNLYPGLPLIEIYALSIQRGTRYIIKNTSFSKTWGSMPVNPVLRRLGVGRRIASFSPHQPGQHSETLF
jgi:hypothetical protein